MKKILSIVIIITIIITSISISKGSDTIIVYTCMEQTRNAELQEQLKKEFPDLNIFVMYMSTGKLATKLLLEGKDTDGDIIVCLESAYMNKVEQHMADVSQYSNLEYLEDMKVDNGKSLIWDRQSGSMIVNKKVLEKYNLEMPKTYEDLLKPEYENLIAMPDPKMSGTGFFFLLSMINAMGEEEAFQYMDRLADNVKQFTDSGSGPVKLLIQGEVAVGLGLTFQAVNEMNEGNDFEIIIPEYGAPYSVTHVAMVDGREKDKDIEKVFRYIVNDFMVYDKTYFSPEQVLKHQTNKVENSPSHIDYADMTGIENLEEKERILSKWKY